jgi:hypothetical protein
MRLNDCNIPTIRIALSCKLEAYITGGQINFIDFSKTILSKDTIISFSGTYIYSISLEEFAMLGNLFFRKISKLEDLLILDENYVPNYDEYFQDCEKSFLNKLHYHKMIVWNNKIIFYKDLNKELKIHISNPTIRISQSSLGNTEFTDCPLGNFNFEYNNSKIVDCFISGGTIPENKISIIHPVHKEKITGLDEQRQKALFYNQLKKVFEAQGDIYNSTISQAKWAIHQEKYLKLKRKEENSITTKRFSLNKLKSLFNENSQDIYTLWLNKISNNHGESWLRALGWLFAFSFIFYILYLWSIGRCFTNSTIDFNLIGYFFEFLNPLHKFDFIPDTPRLGGLSTFLDFASKLFAAFFIYKFLSAFRKHGKK